MGVARPCAVRRCGSWSLKAWGKVVGDILCAAGGGKKVGDLCLRGMSTWQGEREISAICQLRPLVPSSTTHTARAHVLRGLDSTVPLTYPRPTFVHCTYIFLQPESPFYLV